jgi:hypothetical protein
VSKKKDKPGNRRKTGWNPDIGKATQFKPGQSGNPDGRPKKRLIDDLLEEILGNNESEVAGVIAQALVKRARKGDVRAIQLAVERTQGKARQPVEVSGPGGGPVAIQIVSHISRPKRAGNNAPAT